MRRGLSVLCLCGALLQATIIDKIDIRVSDAIIKDSDILRNLRVTDFLNNHPLTLNLPARREAAKRLIDQIFIREEIRLGDYPRAEWSEADTQLDKLKRDRFHSTNAYLEALKNYGLTDADLRFEFHWQLTVLRFIDARFRPGVLVTDSEIQRYFQAHQAAFHKPNEPVPSLDNVRDQVRDIITGEKVNDEFFAWLDGKRKTNKIVFYEEILR